MQTEPRRVASILKKKLTGKKEEAPIKKKVIKNKFTTNVKKTKNKTANW